MVSLLVLCAVSLVPVAEVNMTAGGKWSVGPVLQQARFYHAAAAIGSKIYAIQGQNMQIYLQTVEVLDITQQNGGAWGTAASISAAPAREGHSAAAVGTKIYCIGGTLGSTVMGNVMVFDQSVASDGWKAGPSLATPRWLHASAAINTKIYVVGGNKRLNTIGDTVTTVEVLATAAGGGWTAGPSLSQARLRHGLVAVGTKLYAIGGLDFNVNPPVHVTSVEVLDTVGGGGWEPGPTLTSQRDSSAVAALGTTIYLVSGCSIADYNSCPMLVFDTTGAVGWVSGPSPRGTSEWAAAAIVIGARLFVIGGTDLVGGSKHEALAHVDVFDPSAPPTVYPVCETAWPKFASAQELSASPAWAGYFTDLYGTLPTTFPLNTADWWMLYDSLLTKHAIKLPQSAGQCAPPNCQLNLFGENNMYSPPSKWIWHPPPLGGGGYPMFAANQWVEVMHEADPFGDEHYGAWFLYAKGSGVWYNIGKTLSFPEHLDAYIYFNVRDNEAMCRAAAAAGYDTLQFTQHRDTTNYPCTRNPNPGKYPYMNIEIVAVKLQGTYPCGSLSKPDPNVLRSGYADKPCDCDNSLSPFSNCGRSLLDSSEHRTWSSMASQMPGREGSRSSPSVLSALAQSRVPADCSNAKAADPPWFSTCLNDGGCVRVSINTTLQPLIQNSTFGPNATVTMGMDWCIDHTNLVVYTKMSDTPSRSAAFFEATFDDTTGRACRFLTHHWISGDIVRVYQHLHDLNCTLDWDQLTSNVTGVTQATLHMYIA